MSSSSTKDTRRNLGSMASWAKYGAPVAYEIHEPIMWGLSAVTGWEIWAIHEVDGEQCESYTCEEGLTQQHAKLLARKMAKASGMEITWDQNGNTVGWADVVDVDHEPAEAGTTRERLAWGDYAAERNVWRLFNAVTEIMRDGKRQTTERSRDVTRSKSKFEYTISTDEGQLTVTADSLSDALREFDAPTLVQDAESFCCWLKEVGGYGYIQRGDETIARVTVAGVAWNA